MIRKSVINYNEDAKCYLCGKYNINSKIYINFPTIREIMFDIGENKYWTLVFGIIATSSDLIAELDSKGLDWEKVDDFDIFCINFLLSDSKLMNIIFPTLDTSLFDLKENENGEVVLYDKTNDITIDKNIYTYIVDYMRYVHGIDKNVIKAGNQYTHNDLIEDAHKQLERNKIKLKNQKSQMKARISYVLNYSGYKIDDILDMRINYFFDCVKRISAIETAKTMPFLMYYGMVDGKKREIKNSLDAMRCF